MAKKLLRRGAALAALVTAVLAGAYLAPFIALATHQPADKTAIAASDIDQVDDATPLLTEEIRVSSPADLILAVSAECSILTELITGPSAEGGATDSARAFGSVRLWLTLDGTRVPVSLDDLVTDPEENPPDANDTSDIGEVTFCNRAYQRTVTDGEDDGLDEEHDYIDTRTANAFTWMAMNAGGDHYDQNNDNLLTVQLWADFDSTTLGDAVADAYVGSRTLVIEAVHAANDEQPAQVSDGGASPASGNGNGKGPGR